MQEIFEKIIEKLEERKQLHNRMVDYENKNGTVYEEFQQRKAVEVLNYAIEIVKQEAEKCNNGWILCSERLPEDGETYLVTNAESFGQCHTYKGWYDGKHKIWHMDENFERKMNVIAWQPLPSPYQSKGE